MCFKAPKAAPKSAEDIALEKDLEAQREARKRELAVGYAEEKKDRTEDDIARAMGLFGFRSLIAGPRGGAGFLSAYGGRVTGASGSSLLTRSRKKAGGAAPRAAAPSGPAAAPSGGAGGGYGGSSYGGRGGYGGSFGGPSLIAQ